MYNYVILFCHSPLTAAKFFVDGYKTVGINPQFLNKVALNDVERMRKYFLKKKAYLIKGKPAEYSIFAKAEVRVTQDFLMKKAEKLQAVYQSMLDNDENMVSAVSMTTTTILASVNYTYIAVVICSIGRVRGTAWSVLLEDPARANLGRQVETWRCHAANA